MYIRTTTTGTTSRMLSQLMSNQSDLINTQIQISSQKRVNKPSDDAVASSQILQLNKQLNKIDSYLSNINTAKDQVATLDGALDNVTDVIQRANELAMQAANGTYNNDQLKSMKSEIDQIIASIVDFSNTQYNGQYIFSGNNTSTPAYTIGTDGSITYNGTDGSNDSQRTMEIIEGVYIPLNITGNSIFGYYKPEVPPTDPMDPSTGTPAEGNGILGALSALSVELDKNDPDRAAVSSMLGDIKNGLETVSTTRTQYGAYSAKRLEMTESYLKDLILSIEDQRSGLEDLDVAKAMTDLANKNYAYQASLQTTAQNLQISLLNYM